MPSCVICIDALKSPVALPCGHVFCHECIKRIVDTIRPFTTQHCCPTCRHPYTIATLDTSLIPSHLRPFIFPPIRKIFLDPTPPQSADQHSVSETETSSLKSENLVLRAHCEAWKRRAEVHTAANLGLVNLAKLAKEYALGVKAERDGMERKLNALKRKYGHHVDVEEDQTPSIPTSDPSPSSSDSCQKSEPQDDSFLLRTIAIMAPQPLLQQGDLSAAIITANCESHSESNTNPQPPKKRTKKSLLGASCDVQPLRRSSRHQRCSTKPAEACK